MYVCVCCCNCLHAQCCFRTFFFDKIEIHGQRYAGSPNVNQQAIPLRQHWCIKTLTITVGICQDHVSNPHMLFQIHHPERFRSRIRNKALSEVCSIPPVDRLFRSGWAPLQPAVICWVIESKVVAYGNKTELWISVITTHFPVSSVLCKRYI